ncbi:T9SS type A sorting domain-containing protein [Wenyingzhuangia aestuarii]|uniref:T9SS type A sorting domain-containing protein n=1 Tax=Wenyingzhuangia aestuarii TaxID=1647582 RepID=UPI00143AA327|nr:T9SS type A sorting domain-containing protein [Wenyingzhuangia aestuarii]NJB83101.1 hypothetical protein [Wenyingzhuangia aestuarii]
MITTSLKKHFKSFLLFFIVFNTITAQEIIIPDDNNFFTGTTPSVSKDISLPVTADKINNAINNGGVVINIPAGTHNINKVINLKSNTHILIAKNAVLKPTTAFFMFNIGTNGRGTQQKIKNVKISSTSGKFIIDYSKFNPGDKVSGFTIGWVENFLIQGVLLKDNQTFLSGLSLSPPSGGNWNRIAKNGIINNCTITGADYGYGLIQVQAAENVLFKNLKGYGGVTLRFESGWKSMRDAGINVATSTKLYGLNITGINGNAAVMVSPHTKRQGTAVIKNVTSKNCSFGIRIDKGFDEAGFTAGKYNSVIVGGKIKISRNSDETKNLAQIKQKHYGFYPTQFRNANPFSSFPFTAGTDPIARKAPSIAPILFDAQNTATDFSGGGKYKVTFRKSGHASNTQTYSGFRNCSPKVVYDNDKNNVCPVKRIITNNNISELSTEFNEPVDKVYPNPVSNGKLFVETKVINSVVNIFSLHSGQLITTIKNSGYKNTIDTSSIKPGTYILQIISDVETTNQKIVIL